MKHVYVWRGERLKHHPSLRNKIRLVPEAARSLITTVTLCRYSSLLGNVGDCRYPSVSAEPRCLRGAFGGVMHVAYGCYNAIVLYLRKP